MRIVRLLVWLAIVAALAAAAMLRAALVVWLRGRWT